MKKPAFIVIIAIIGISFISISCCSIPKRGNGNLVTSEKPISAFDSIGVSGSVTVNYHASQEYRAVVTVDSNLDEFVEVYTQGGVLKIGTKSGSYSFTTFIVDVYSPSLSGISVSGSVRFEGMDKIITPTFKLYVSGSGKLKGDFECDTFTTNISGSGDITLTGSSNNLDITVSGSGKLTGNEFQTNNTNVRISGSARVHVWVLDNLKVRSSGSARVKYRGNPIIDYSSAGSARLERE
ncbi:MAG: DUF2807 domain-containing protein [Treponema sp.]|jgi:hypothetical protein|nr:DUF2807 domain-containing protein [Treponema sp.]